MSIEPIIDAPKNSPTSPPIDTLKLEIKKFTNWLNRNYTV
jgi:hypothetical protein